MDQSEAREKALTLFVQTVRHIPCHDLDWELVTEMAEWLFRGRTPKTSPTQEPKHPEPVAGGVITLGLGGSLSFHNAGH